MKDINLLPEDMKKGNEKKKKSGGGFDFRDKLDPKSLLVILGIIFVLFAIFFSPSLYKTYLENQYQDVRDSIESDFVEIYEVDTEMREIEEEREKRQVLMSYIDRENVSISEIFVAMKSVLPQGATITSLNYGGLDVRLNGTVAENLQINEILTRAERFRFFEVDGGRSVTLDGGNEFSLNFNIVTERGD